MTNTVLENGNTAKATKIVVEQVNRFAEVKAEIARLEQEKEALTKAITAAFGKATVLTHHGIEVARLDTRTRESADRETLQKKFPEVWSVVKKATTYKVIVNLFR